jgi:hypothetical protein
MKKIPQHLDDTLLNYLDGNVSASQKESIENMLLGDEDLQIRLEELRVADRALKNVKLENPSLNFTAFIMNNLDKQPVRKGLSIRNGLFLLSGVIIVLIIGTLLLSAGVFDHANTMVDLNNLGLPHQYIRQTLPSIPVDGKLLMYGILFLNLAMGLIVLDRTILKPFFQQRIQAGHS